MKYLIFVILFIVMLLVIIKIFPPFGLPMSVSCDGSSYNIVDSKKKKLLLWEYNIVQNGSWQKDSLELSEAYCEKQHHWKANQIIYLPNLYDDDTKVQIRINTKERSKWNEIYIVDYNSINPIGIVKKCHINDLSDTLTYSICCKKTNEKICDLTLVKRID